MRFLAKHAGAINNPVVARVEFLNVSKTFFGVKGAQFRAVNRVTFAVAHCLAVTLPVAITRGDGRQ